MLELGRKEKLDRRGLEVFMDKEGYKEVIIIFKSWNEGEKRRWSKYNIR